jgi:hypothetical protein
MSKTMTNFAQALVAVILGNAVYFLVLPHLPNGAYHAPLRIDPGLVVDFLLCAVAFGLIKALTKPTEPGR